MELNNIKLRKYNSINEFEKFINETPFNEVFRWAEHSSVKTDDVEWSGTKSFEEAVDLLKHGADDLSKKLESAYKVQANDIAQKTTIRSNYDVAGFQCSVPRYLQGIPTSMINQKRVPQKEKVLTLNKDMCYSASWESHKIIEESAKALAIVKKLESQGYRVNLNVCFVSEAGYESVGCKIKIKHANERLNVSKLAFLMAHPSMLRRMLFRWLEVSPDVTSKFYARSYGTPGDISKIQEAKEYTLPREIKSIDEVIKNMKIS